MLDLHRLRLLRELAHRGTLAAVAASLSYSPSTISAQLSQLEREAGATLLEPVGRGVRLTEQGRLLVAHTEAVLERLELAEAQLAESLSEVTGTIRLAVFQTAALALLPPALTALGARYPRLRVEAQQLDPEFALPALLARDFDLVLAEEYPGDPLPQVPGLERRTLGRDALRLALPPGETEPVRHLRDLAERTWVLEPSGSAVHRWAIALCRTAGFEPDVQFISADLLTQIRLVQNGHALAFIPDLTWRSQRVVTALHPIPGREQVRRISTVTRRGASAHPGIRAVRSAIHDALAPSEPAVS